jgi:acetyltransferase
VVENAHRHRIRLLGPNCLGVLRPQLGVNATFAHASALKGSIGLISQSGALCAAILDWAKPNNVGFSTVVSLGTSVRHRLRRSARVHDLGPAHREHLPLRRRHPDARRFMSALRGAARVKPVLLIKAGRHPGASRADPVALGAPMGEDAVFDAALRRAGVIRLYNMGQLFAAANALFSHFRPRGNRLAIITNGGGPGVMAADRAADIGIPLAEFSEARSRSSTPACPSAGRTATRSTSSATPTPSATARPSKAVLEGPNVDGVLVMLTPQAMTNPTGVAEQ